jgi:hypothetical protein
MIKLVNPRNIKKRGRESIFKIGRIDTLMIPRIIPPVKNILKASRENIEQFPQANKTPDVIPRD